jgi:hypothetical protein
MKAVPSSVNDNRRVVRLNNRTRSSASSVATFLLTAAGVKFKTFAAAEKLPLSAVCTALSRPGRVVGKVVIAAVHLSVIGRRFGFN